MGKLFGTDGIRGIVHQEPMTPETGIKFGRSVVKYFSKRSPRPAIVIGRDTRGSGKMLESAIVSGILSMGGNPVLLGELPTPGVALIARTSEADAGIVISASHNPHEYNGFKLFSGEGYKLTDEAEAEIEDFILSDVRPEPGRIEAGEVLYTEDAMEQYISFLVGSLPEGAHFQGMRIVLDCANGATYRIAPDLFNRLGAVMEALFTEPDGMNINRECGSQHTESLSKRVLETEAQAGLAFDGDGDRLIAVDESGAVLSGDQIIMACAKMLKDQGELPKDLVVSTVMSNLGFRLGLEGHGMNHAAADVGDRYVMEEMKARGAALGGEESGHIIFLQHHTTGDGILSALKLLWAMKSSDQPLSRLSKLMTVFPQAMINVEVKEKPEISSVPELMKIIGAVEDRMGDKGRVLVRYSGTEPVCRVMIEGEDQKEIEAYARQIADVVSKSLNTGV